MVTHPGLHDRWGTWEQLETFAVWSSKLSDRVVLWVEAVVWDEHNASIFKS